MQSSQQNAAYKLGWTLLVVSTLAANVAFSTPRQASTNPARQSVASPQSVEARQSPVKSSSIKDDVGAFENSNPFTDEALWRIPIHLVRDMSASEPKNGRLTKSASEMSFKGANMEEMDEGDDDDLYTSAQMVANSPKLASSSSAPTVISASTDLKTAAGYHYPSSSHGDHHGYPSHGGHHYGKYYQYASVPYPYAWEFGYRRGNPYHTIERHEHGKGPHFKTKVKWSDKKGYGVHVWDYNHDDHHSHYGHGGHHSGYHGRK